MTNWLDLKGFRQVCFELAATASWIELKPIPAFKTRFPGRLESCLATPQQTFDGELLYPTLVDQATIFFYLLIKNHPFENGNKRIALLGLIIFLLINSRWIEATNDELYELTIEVASSEAVLKAKILEKIKSFIQSNITDIPQEFLDSLAAQADMQDKV